MTNKDNMIASSSTTAEEKCLPITCPSNDSPESSINRSSSGTKRRRRPFWVILALTAFFLGGVIFALVENDEISLITTRITSLYLLATTTISSATTNFHDPLHIACKKGVVKTLLASDASSPDTTISSTPEFCVDFYKNVIIDMTSPTSTICPTRQRVVFDVIESKVCFDVATPEQIAAGIADPDSFATNFCNRLGLGGLGTQ